MAKICKVSYSKPSTKKSFNIDLPVDRSTKVLKNDKAMIWPIVGGGGTMCNDRLQIKMTRYTNFAYTGPIRLKIGQRCGFSPEIIHT